MQRDSRAVDKSAFLQENARDLYKWTSYEVGRVATFHRTIFSPINFEFLFSFDMANVLQKMKFDIKLDQCDFPQVKDIRNNEFGTVLAPKLWHLHGNSYEPSLEGFREQCVSKISVF